jgi:hypothetical protein
MAIFQQTLEKLTHFPLAPTAARTESFTGATTNIADLKDFDGDIQIILDAAAAGADGTKTLALKIQHSNTTTGGDFADVDPAVAFTSLTTSASKQVITVNRDALRRYIRLVTTQGAGSTYTYGVNGYGLKKYG